MVAFLLGGGEKDCHSTKASGFRLSSLSAYNHP